MAMEVPAGAGLAFETGLRALDEQLRRIESLDSKAGITIAADGVLAGLLLNRASLLSIAPRPLSVLVAVALFSSLTTAILSFMTRRYEFAPSAPVTVRLMIAEEDWIKWRVLTNVLDAVRNNALKLERKAHLLTAALWSLLAAITVVGGYFVDRVIAGGVIR